MTQFTEFNMYPRQMTDVSVNECSDFFLEFQLDSIIKFSHTMLFQPITELRQHDLPDFEHLSPIQLRFL